MIDTAARYGRLMILDLDGLHWPRLAANASSRPLYEKLMVCGAYVAPVAPVIAPLKIMASYKAGGIAAFVAP